MIWLGWRFGWAGLELGWVGDVVVFEGFSWLGWKYGNGGRFGWITDFVRLG